MEESPRAARPRELEENLDCKAQFINMELVMKKLSSGWEESPRMRRGVQAALESQDEFEFTMSNFSAKDDLFEPAMEVAPADELFFRGQLLPLEHDPRAQLVHSLSGMQQSKQFGDSSGCTSAAEDELAMKIAYAEAFPFAASAHDDQSLLHTSVFHVGAPLKGVVDEEACVQGMITSNTAAVKPHRSDGGMDAAKSDSRSSSFRSLQSSYWGSGEKDSRDSSSSSRCSNGSSQDGCLHGAERKEMQQNKAMATNGYANGKGDAIDKADDVARHSKPAMPSAAKAKKWSWRALFSGLRKASKIWVDDRGEENSHFAPQRDANSKKKSVFGLVSAGQQANKGMDQIDVAGPSCHGREVCKAWQQAASREKGLNLEEYGKHTCSKSYMGYRGHRGHNYYEGSNGGRPGKERGARLGIIAWNARDSWQKWVKKPLSGKLSSNTHKHGGHEDILPSFNVRAKSLSSTPLSKSPVRRADNVANTPDVYGSASTSKYIGVGLAASCPASMRSSPHHSGVLAVVSKSPSPSSLHDLHTAIQGAIAHCKQSQSADPQ